MVESKLNGESVDPYESLGLKPDATPAQIKRAWQKAAKKHHPDKGGDKATFQQASDAYNILSDTNRRLRYDTTGTTTVEDHNAVLMSQFAMLLDAVLEREDIDTVPLIDIMLNQIASVEAQILEARKQTSKKIARRESVIKRFKRKQPGNDLIGLLLQNGITVLKEALFRQNAQLQIYKEMRDVLKDYTYKTDPASRDIGLGQGNFAELFKGIHGRYI